MVNPLRFVTKQTILLHLIILWAGLLIGMQNHVERLSIGNYQSQNKQPSFSLFNKEDVDEHDCVNEDDDT